ncbi:MAG TPA: hypothetical protein VFF73_23555 [Planctomycetota bacterium]|nr:hypothetical protein [Planctomycetota bacterium]
MKWVLALAPVLVACASRPPCEEPVEGPPGDPAQIESNVAADFAPAKLVHLVTFEMGPMVESLEGYMVRNGYRLRIYGMSETGQKAFDVAVAFGKVTRIYRAPFLKDDRLLDQIAFASEKIFVLRPWGTLAGPRPWVLPAERAEEGYVCTGADVRWCFSGPHLHLRWLQGKGYYACFMGWSTKTGVYAPERIHFHSDEGPYPYDLTMKLVAAKALETPPPDSLFEAPK